MKLFSIPRDIWLSIRDFLDPADMENIMDTGRSLWLQIFKDFSWIDTAVQSGQGSPVLISHNLSSFRPRNSSNRLYLSFIMNNSSDDLYKTKKFKVYFPSGIILNIYNIIKGDKIIELSLKKIFINIKKGSYTEYYYYNNYLIKELQLSEIIK
ncbi:hypothetical protein ASPFODRAFT_126002 [Aspergillus luchuensis CBS 106.47]|uniref:F-box domain-containing protein n=1 Tax=Aspergillus luchuensis (strain CBS 106.47) TaxID=1137211 RepID=A0A1M3TWM7_ASPLC|nr:hypothetical protein ASPFODRAFT_126002 [Aspergillus luchuensis CBS 106.47]